MCSVERLSVFAGTWNVNGGKNMYNVAFRHEQSLDAWIFPPELCKRFYFSNGVLKFFSSKCRCNALRYNCNWPGGDCRPQCGKFDEGKVGSEYFNRVFLRLLFN